MVKSNVIRCLKRDHVLSQEEIEKGCCYKCQAIESGIMPEIEDKKKEKPKDVNPDSTRLEKAKGKYDIRGIDDRPIENQHTGVKSWVIILIIVVLIILPIIIHFFITR